MLNPLVLTKLGMLVQGGTESTSMTHPHQDSQRAESTEVLQRSENCLHRQGRHRDSAPTELEETEGLHHLSQSSSQGNKRETYSTETDSVKREYVRADNIDLVPFLKLQFLIVTPSCTTHPGPYQRAKRKSQ